MELLVKALIALAGVAFLLAIVGSLGAGPIMGVGAEAFSRASTNLALLAIALSVADWGQEAG